jgi:hypothetical protein
MTIGTSGWVNPSKIPGLGCTIISTELGVQSTKPKSYGYFYELAKNNLTIQKPIRASMFIGFTVSTFLTTNPIFYIGGTSAITWGATAYLSGDALSSTYSGGFNARTWFGSTRSIVTYNNAILYANSGNSVTFNGRFGQSGSISNYKYQCWYNIGSGWILISTTTATGGNGASAVSTFTYNYTSRSGIYAVASSLSTTGLKSSYIIYLLSLLNALKVSSILSKMD